MTSLPSSAPKNVALVLSSGGARGYAHIGAIRALEQRGYRITSVAGASMGALVGGLYCAGHLDEAEKWFCSLTRGDMLKMLDLSLSMNHVVKGERVMNKLREITPDVKIETLPIPFRAIASDLLTQREVVFSRGSLFRAIRSSISMPSVFKPIRVARHILIDGGIVNPLPINRAVRQEGDLLVSINVSAPASEEVAELRQAAKREHKEGERLLSLQKFFSLITPNSVTGNYLTLISSAMELQIQRNTVLAQKITPPDIAVNIPINRFGVFDFDHAQRIIRTGYEQTLKALDAYERGQQA